MGQKHHQEPWWLLTGLLFFRLLNALLVQTYFNPDEYWQSLEVAHRLVFGYGYVTWEWREGIRGYAHPLIFAALYKFLALCGWDSAAACRVAPRLLQGAFAAVGDLFLYKLTKRVFSSQAAKWALVCQLLNWFTFFCIVRPFSNCLETVLTTAALFYWPLHTKPPKNFKPLARDSQPPIDLRTQRPKTVDGAHGKVEVSQTEGRHSSQEARVSLKGPQGTSSGSDSKSVNRPLALLLAGLACILRPTSAVLWAYMGVWELGRTRDKGRFVFSEVLPIGVLCLGASTLVDRWMYGEWTIVPLNFIRFNLSGGADAYGTHPWHWYFTGGLPAMATTLLPFAAVGVWRSKGRALADVIVWVMGAYSLLGHKEFRFILPVLPLVMAFAGEALAALDGIPAHSLPTAASSASGFATQRPPPETTAPHQNLPIPPSMHQRRPRVPPEISEAKACEFPFNGSDEKQLERAADVMNSGKLSARPLQSSKGSVTENPDVTTADVTPPPASPQRLSALRVALAFLVLTQVPMALYFSVVHQRGAVRVAEWLAGEADRGRVSGVWFLMPCHSTPFFSHVHARVPMRILNCAPSSEPGHVREDDLFYRDPAAFLSREFKLLSDQGAKFQVPEVDQRRPPWQRIIGSAAEGLLERPPSHVVLFEPVEQAVEDLLSSEGYAKGPRFFHAHFPVDRALQSHVVVYTRPVVGAS